ncbi:MAG TPA: CDP-alcohol phosphatidyltransferase family protein [Gemmatimonadaceae bacterium]|nr:CDP-alcohol phosphatidyltransferase family protein [Gemmatimonadaceae bacterium]
MRRHGFLVGMLRRDVLTTPNLISLSRLAMAGVFLGIRDADWRLGVVLAAMVSDVLDGVIARISHTTSRIGALIDPIADRIFMLVAFIAVTVDGLISPMQLGLLMVRDVMTVIGWFVARNVSWLRSIPFQARWPGKGVTVLQFVTLLAALQAPRVVAGLALACGILALVATADYTLMLWINRAGGPNDVGKPDPRASASPDSVA